MLALLATIAFSIAFSVLSFNASKNPSSEATTPAKSNISVSTQPVYSDPLPDSRTTQYNADIYTLTTQK